MADRRPDYLGNRLIFHVRNGLELLRLLRGQTNRHRFLAHCTIMRQVTSTINHHGGMVSWYHEARPLVQEDAVNNQDMQSHSGAEVTVFIDASPLSVRRGNMTGEELRRTCRPPVLADKDLWLDILDEQDRVVGLTDTIEIVEGLRFFTEIPAISIRIDRVEYPVYVRKMTGAQLRTLPSPDVAADRDLWLDVPDKRDLKIQDEDVIRLHDGTRFFTAPGRINPGGAAELEVSE